MSRETQWLSLLSTSLSQCFTSVLGVITCLGFILSSWLFTPVVSFAQETVQETLSSPTPAPRDEVKEPIEEGKQLVIEAKAEGERVVDETQTKASQLSDELTKTSSDIVKATQELQSEAATMGAPMIEGSRGVIQDARELQGEFQEGVKKSLGEVKDIPLGIGEVKKEAEALAREQADALSQEVKALREQLKKAQSTARSVSQDASSPMEWLFEVNPNLDGSLALTIGSDFRYLENFALGLSYRQIRRIQRDECDRFASDSCKAYAEITDDQITFKGFGYTLALTKMLSVTFNLSGLFLRQVKEGTTVDITLDRYEDMTSRLNSLQLNTQLKLDWRLSEDSLFTLEGSGSPYYRSVETEEGYDSGLVSRMSGDSERVGNSNNVFYTGQLGVYNRRYDMDTTFLDGTIRLYVRDTIKKSDMDISLSGRYLSYGAEAVRTVIFNGELDEQTVSQSFSKLDLFAKVAFELSFLNFEPLSPLLGVTYTYSVFEGIKEVTYDTSLGLSVSFTTPPLD